MKIDHPTAKLIQAALTKPINVTYLLNDEDFINDVDKKAKIYYENENDKRDFDGVLSSTLLGELGECAIFGACKQQGLNVIHNDESLTKEFYWDVSIEGARCEIKFKSKHDPFYFSFDSKKKDDVLFKNWKLYDLIISFYIKVIEGETFVIPWLLIDNSAIDQTLLFRGLPYYRDSIRFRGRYLLKEAEQAGLFIRLNVNQNMFTF